jgi:hypothetical protein
LRWLALVAGAALIALAAASVIRVADTREGLIAEVVTLFAAMAGVILLIYGLAARPRPAPAQALTRRPAAADLPRKRERGDLLLGAGGVALALALLAGLAVSGGLLWAGFGLALLLPMIAGSVYLCVRFLRSRP